MKHVEFKALLLIIVSEFHENRYDSLMSFVVIPLCLQLPKTVIILCF